MKQAGYILAIDQGTSSTKALLFDQMGTTVKKGVAPLQTQYLPDGLVEQDPLAILESVRRAAQQCLEGIGPEQILGVGISNQRETFVLWDAAGQPVCPAVVWSCKRSVAICNELKEQETWLRRRTGLMADPYFSATKLLWLLRHQPGLQQRVNRGEIAFGTVDTWLLYNLTGGRSYATDHTNASRTLLMHLQRGVWDSEILENWGLTGLRLPEIRPSASHFGETDLFAMLDTPIPVLAMIGDSHAALFGEGCFGAGDTKITLGTGCSLLSNAGAHPNPGADGILGTVAWSTQEGIVHAREGAIVACGSMVEWLISAGLLSSAEASEALALAAEPDPDLALIPAFSGLGAPFWQMDRKASFHGLGFGTTRGQLVRATLESICFQIRAVLDAFEAAGSPIRAVAVHGGLSKNRFIRQTLSGLLQAEIYLQDNADISAQGAAFLAGLQAGMYPSVEHLQSLLRREALSGTPDPGLQQRYNNWLNLINA